MKLEVILFFEKTVLEFAVQINNLELIKILNSQNHY